MSKMLILSLLFFLVVGCTATQVEKPSLDISKLNMGLESALALQKAQDLYQKSVAQEQDLSNGPCLSNELHGNPDYPQTMWVLDIAHEPRIEVDDLPENQCPAYKEGRAENFIEFSPQGQLIKLYSPLLNQQKK